MEVTLILATIATLATLSSLAGLALTLIWHQARQGRRHCGRPTYGDGQRRAGPR